MIICAFTDFHGNKKSFLELKKRAEQADVILCLGDISIFGKGIETIGLLLNQFEKKVLIIPGNHELEEEIALISNRDILNMHKIIYKHQGITFMGFGGGGFTRKSPEFIALKKTIPKTMHIDVLMIHQPPFGTIVDKLEENLHVGNTDFTDFIKEHKPILVLCGHLHENFNKSQKMGTTLIANPGPSGKLFEIKDGKAKEL